MSEEKELISLEEFEKIKSKALKNYRKVINKYEIKEYNDLKQYLKELGIEDELVPIMFRLLIGKPTIRELKRWKKLNIVNKYGKIEVESNKGISGIEICLFAACWLGWVSRVDIPSVDKDMEEYFKDSIVESARK